MVCPLQVKIFWFYQLSPLFLETINTYKNVHPQTHPTLYPVLEMKILITGSNQILEFIFIYTLCSLAIQKTEKFTGPTKFYRSWARVPVLIMRTEQSFTGLGPEYWCSSWGLNKVLLVLGQRNGAHRGDWTKFYWSWARGLNKVLLVLDQRTGAHHEDWTKFNWSWTRGLVLIVRTAVLFCFFVCLFHACLLNHKSGLLLFIITKTGVAGGFKK